MPQSTLATAARPSTQIFKAGFAVLLATGAALLVISSLGLSHELAIGCDENARFRERLLVELSGPASQRRSRGLA